MHFTYASLDLKHLHQGDVLRRTPELEAILQVVHPHYYLSSKFRFFQVLTQSCDLVRRDGEGCSSSYISVAAVRPVEDAIERQAKKLLFDKLEKRLLFAPDDRQAKLRQFVESLLNNNAPHYFFLRAEPDDGLNNDHATFLQLSIALRSGDHYETLLAAKTLQLAEPFEHKLGWLVGSEYSRVGTRDWPTDDVYTNLLKKYSSHSSDFIWLDKSTHRRVLDELKKLPDADQTLDSLLAIRDRLGSAKNRNREALLSLVVEASQKAGLDAAAADLIASRLRNNPQLSPLVSATA